MNVASLELCKELYELSRWDETPFYWRSDFEFCRYPDEWKHSVIYAVHKNYTLGGWIKDDTEEARIYNPAYDLGYLMRKLPEPVSLLKRDGIWECGMANPAAFGVPVNHWVIGADNDTPESVAAKLAIELFRQGVLKHE